MRILAITLGITIVCSFAQGQDPLRPVQLGPVTREAPAAEQKIDREDSGQQKQAIQDVPKVTEEEPMSFWMAQKLEFSKSLLESLTMGDFDKLSVDAKQMRLLGKIESFVRRKNADYRIQVRNFDVALGELITTAEQGNVTGATVAFNQMTTSCVACHALLREGID